MMFLVYKFLWWIILPWVLFFRYFKDRKSGKAFKYLIERLGFAPTVRPHDIVLHAVSLGEARAMMPLIFAIRKNHPSATILVTTTTLTGRAQLESVLKNQASVAFLPHDVGFFTRRFLKKVQPKILMIMETELWPNLLNACEQLNIPAYIISACLSERSQKGYAKFPKTLTKLLAHVYILTQTAEDRQRFLSIGAKNVSVMGNLKYLTVLPDDFAKKETVLLQGKGDALIWCLASSHDGEEELIIEVFQQLKQQYPYLKLAIAPRHPERFLTVEALLQSHDLTYQKRSQTQLEALNFNACDVWLFDTIGELLYLYAASDIVTVGGSFVPIGGHNILEPAFLSKAITVGPYIDNIQDMVDQFSMNDAISVFTPDALYNQVENLIMNEDKRSAMGDNAHQVIQNNQGALLRVMQALEQCLLLEK